MRRLFCALPLRTGLLLLALPLAALVGTTALSHAQTAEYPIVLTITGPATAVSGQEITYLVAYRLTDPETVSQAAVIIQIPRNTTFVSTKVVSGPQGTFEDPVLDVRWGVGSAEETEGQLALTVRIDDGYVGPIYGQSYVPGTETFNPESQYSVETQVSPPDTLPQAGSGAAADGSGFPIVPALLALSGAALAGIVLVAAGTTIRRQS